jgi:ATP-dependent Clp protease ATP-binding subunit ClpA
MSRSGIEAARRKFTPEFMNRIDKTVVFKPLGQNELRRILDLELGQVQQRIMLSPAEKTFVFTVSDAGKSYLLSEGTDMKYGARHLKRAIERFLVHPLSNLMATSQVNAGDWIQADFDPERNCLLFTKEAEGLEVQAMASMIGENFRMPPVAAAMSNQTDLAKTVSAGKSSKK